MRTASESARGGRGGAGAGGGDASTGRRSRLVDVPSASLASLIDTNIRVHCVLGTPR